MATYKKLKGEYQLYMIFFIWKIRKVKDSNSPRFLRMNGN